MTTQKSLKKKKNPVRKFLQLGTITLERETRKLDQNKILNINHHFKSSNKIKAPIWKRPEKRRKKNKNTSLAKEHSISLRECNESLIPDYLPLQITHRWKLEFVEARRRRRTSRRRTRRTLVNKSEERLAARF